MNKLIVTGNDYEMGYQIGKHFKEYLSKNITRYEEALKNKGIYEKVKSHEKILKRDFNNGLLEIYGRADGANINRDAYLLWMFPEIFKTVDGCTTAVLIDKNGKVLFSHNEDDSSYSLDNVALIKYQYKDYWYVGYGACEKLGGSCFGYNSYGLVFSSNYINPKTINLDYVSRYVMVRDIMNCDSIENCLKRLKEIKVSSPFSLNIIDIKTQKVINVEKDHKKIYVKSVDDRWARSNHFIIKKDDVKRNDFSTQFRYAKTKELVDLLTKDSTIEDVSKILDYQEEEYDRCIYKDYRRFIGKSRTVAKFSYDGNNNEIIINDYIDNTYDKYKFEEFNV